MPAAIETMMYVGDRPWHGLGTYVESELTSEKAIVAAGLDWTVKLSPVCASLTGHYSPDSEDFKAVVRMSDERILGVVGGRYHPVQNKGAFDFFDSVVGEGKAIYHTAGALGNGSRIWMLAKLPQDMVLANGEKIEKFMLLSNSHDGSSPLRMLLTPIRVVCQNTLNMALKGTKDGINIRHTASIEQKIQEAQRALGLAVSYYKEFETTANQMMVTPFTEAQMVNVVANMFPVEDGAPVPTRTQNTRDTVMDLFKGAGKGMDTIKNTMWGAYQAVTEFADHHRATRAVGNTSESEAKLTSVWFGSSAAMKNAALVQIQQQVA